MVISSHRTHRAAVTDSPWFWVLLFAVAGMLSLLVISSKYSKRQGRLELQYQAHQEKARRQVEGVPSAREAGEEGDMAPPPAGELIIPLWPLVTLLAAIGTGSAVMLWHGNRQSNMAAPPSNREGPS